MPAQLGEQRAITRKEAMGKASNPKALLASQLNMAIYGAQPQSKGQSAGLSSTSFGREQNNGGLFADLLSSQPSPKNLTVPQKDLLVFFRQLAVILQSGVPLAGLAAHR